MKNKQNEAKSAQGAATSKPQTFNDNVVIARIANTSDYEPKKPEEKPQEAKVEAPVLPPVQLQDILVKNEKINLLLEKRHRFKTAEEDLEKFQIVADRESCRLVITDISGKNFSTTSSDFITEVLENMKSKTKLKLQEIEEQIIANY